MQGPAIHQNCPERATITGANVTIDPSHIVAKIARAFEFFFSVRQQPLWEYVMSHELCAIMRLAFCAHTPPTSQRAVVS